MGTMTLAIPNNLLEEMRNYSEIKWSEVARKAIRSRIEVLRMADKIAAKSKLTKKDVDDFSKMIKESANKRYMSENSN